MITVRKRDQNRVFDFLYDTFIRILKNTMDLQVVRNRKLKMWHLVLYALEIFESCGLSVRADRPFILQLLET